MFSNELPNVGTKTGEHGAEMHTDRDLSKVSMFGGLESHGDPFNIPLLGPENHILESYCFREVDRSRARVTYGRM